MPRHDVHVKPLLMMRVREAVNISYEEMGIEIE